VCLGEQEYEGLIIGRLEGNRRSLNKWGECVEPDWRGSQGFSGHSDNEIELAREALCAASIYTHDLHSEAKQRWE
jgi:hypothetical protein